MTAAPTIALRPRPTRTTGGLARTVVRIAVLAGLLGACSTVPPDHWPPRLEGSAEILYRFEDHPRPIEVPGSDDRLTLIELSADQPIEERVLAGQRWWVPAEGTHRLRIRCRYRYLGAEGRAEPFADAPQMEKLFPGGEVVAHQAAVHGTPGGTEIRAW